MIKCTIWERKVGHGVWAFNHTEAGWTTDMKPIPMTEKEAKYWKDSIWRKFYAYETEDGKLINSL